MSNDTPETRDPHAPAEGAADTSHAAAEAPAEATEAVEAEAGQAHFAEAAHAEPVEAAPEVQPEPVPEAPVAPMEAPAAEAVVAADAGAHVHEDEEAPEAGEQAKDEVFEIAKTILYALLIALVLRVFLFQPFTIPSASMEPNLYEGDYIIVSKWDYGYSKHSMPFSPPIIKGRLFNTMPHRGDVVVFKLPRDNKTDYIKRVIGLPGDQIQMLDNQLYINGKAVPNVHTGKPAILPPDEAKDNDIQQYRETLPGGKVHLMQDFGPYHRLDTTPVYTVPAGYYFMMGDNRDNSQDSRVPVAEDGVGYVPAENLVGRARVIMFSWHPGASLWKPWTWFTKLRLSRFFHGLQ
ncbi:MAG: signal peptidase I [Proteobacteria bacterium]|nr:signal peptidase I [Pseudomonadota bacterium]